MINRKEEGFTLTETMVVVVVFTAVMSLALTVFLASIRTQRVALFQQRITMETSYALSKIAEEIRSGEKDASNITKAVVEGFLSGTVKVNDVKTLTSANGERTTVLVITQIKVDEKRDIEIRLQTTAKKR